MHVVQSVNASSKTSSHVRISDLRSFEVLPPCSSLQNKNIDSDFSSSVITLNPYTYVTFGGHTEIRSCLRGAFSQGLPSLHCILRSIQGFGLINLGPEIVVEEGNGR